MKCHLSAALLESSALQLLILQSLVSMLHDSSKMIFSVHGDPGFLTLQTCVGTNGSSALYSGRQTQDDNQPKATLLRFPIKSAPHIHTPQKTPLYPSCFISLASFKEIKVSILYTVRKELLFFFQPNSYCAWQTVLRLWKYLKGMLPGPMPLCFVYQSDDFSRPCSNYKATSLCIETLQGP